MPLPRVPEIERMFARAVKYEDHKPEWPYYATPKLNGVRAMWVPKVGFFSRDGIPWEPGMLAHLEETLRFTDQWIDGEFYVHGMPLQLINSIVGINRRKPHPDAAKMQFNAFDLPQIPAGFEDRQALLVNGLRDLPNIVPLNYVRCACCDKGESAFKAYASAGYEGVVYKSGGCYQPGLSKMMIKRKLWIDDDFDIVKLLPGQEGKHDHSMGAVICKTAAGLEFEVGSFTFNDALRLSIFFQNPPPTRAKIRYQSLTADGKPFHAQVLCMY